MTQRSSTTRPSTLLTIAALLALALSTPHALAGALPEIGDNSGAFTHSIPIPVPDGPAGATPELQLLYSSAGGNGNAGVGWSLPYSAIRLDQSWGVPRYWLDGIDPCDPEQFDGRLWLDGQELIPSRHDPLAPEQCTYRTRPDTFSLVVPIQSEVRCTNSDGPNVDLPTGFAVNRNDGTTWWYGATECDSPYVDRADDGTPTKWLLQHVQDRDGNLVTYWPGRGTGPGNADSVEMWWSGLAGSPQQACDGCLRAVSWGARAKDATQYAFDAQLQGSPASDVVIAGAQQPYSAQHAGLTGKFDHFLADPGQFWPVEQSHYYAIQVDWEERPDVRTSFMSGAAERLDRRIRQIAVFADTDVERFPFGAVTVAPLNSPIRTYRLDYDQGSTGRSRLVRVWPIAGQYAADADYSTVLGTGFPQTGFDGWDPATFASNPLVPNPWELVWSDSTTLDPDQEGGPTLADFDVFMPIDGSSLRAHAPVPWMGANWREGGYPTITMMDLNGDQLPEIVQHDEQLPKYLSAADNLMEFFNPYADYVFGADELGVANDGVASNHFWVRWNRGDGFSDLEPGPLDPFALQEVADWLPSPDPEDEDAEWELPSLDELLDEEDFDAGAVDLGEYLASAGVDSICGLWWTGGHSAGQLPFPVEIAAWCEHRSCAPYCEPGTTIATGRNARADNGHSSWPLSALLTRQTTRANDFIEGRGDELVLWRKYAVTRAATGDIAATVADPPFNEDALLTTAGGSPFEPRTITRWVDGYARPSFQTRVASTNVELLRASSNYQGTLAPDEVRWLKVRDGLVHDTIDINGDGYPDRVLGGAGVLEHGFDTDGEHYTAPNEALFNPNGEAPKDLVVSTQHMPWFVSLYDPDRGEFAEITPWQLPLGHPLMMGGGDVFTEDDDRLFSDFGKTPDFNFLSVWESNAQASGAPVSGGASVSVGPSGPSAGLSASIGPVSIGGSITSGRPGFSVGVGPVSFTTGGLSVGPVSVDFGAGVQTGAQAGVAAAWFVVQKALEILEVPWQVGIQPAPTGVTVSAGPYGGDCLNCQTVARYKRQGLVDLNGDGLLDYVIAEPVSVSQVVEQVEDWIVVLNEGHGFAAEPILWPGVAANYLDLSVTDPYRDGTGTNTRLGYRRSHQVAGLQDFNGDGLVDFVYTGLRTEDGCEAPAEEGISESGGPGFRWIRRLPWIEQEQARLTLCVQLNSGDGFAPPLDWFDGSTPPELFTAERGFAPSLGASHLFVERSPLYADGYGVEVIGVRDWNGDGLPDLYRMDPRHSSAFEDRVPVVYLNDGVRFDVSPVSSEDRYGQLGLDRWEMRNDQHTSTAAHDIRFNHPHPLFDIERNHRRPGGGVVQSRFVDLDGDGRLDWAQSYEGYNTGDGRREGVGIRLYPLQDAVPDVLVQLWEPGGGTQRMTYRPAKDFMDLPHAPNGRTLPGGTPMNDGVEDVYPASAQVLSSTVVYDGLGTRGSDPVAVAYTYGDPDFAMADPSLTAGNGVMHPSFRRRPMGFARIAAQPCPLEDLLDNGACIQRGFPDVVVVQEYGTDWKTAALPYEQRVLDGFGRLRSLQTTHWDANTFVPNYDYDPRPDSAFSWHNWHYAPVLVESESFDLAGERVRTAVRTAYDDRNGMALCTATDLTGDDHVDRVEWSEYDSHYIDDGKRDATFMDGVSMLPLGAMNVFDEPHCGHRSEVQSNTYAVRRTTYERYPSGRVAAALTHDIAANETLTVTYDYLPNGMPYETVDPGQNSFFTLYDPVVGATPIAELAPPNLAAGVEFLTTREVCGLTTSCEAGAWGQTAEETTPSGRVAFTDYDALGRPIAAGDDMHVETARMSYARPIRMVAVDEEPLGFDGGWPAYVSATRPVAPGIDIVTHSYTDGLGRTLLVAEDWVDETGQPGQRVAGGERRDWRGRTEETPWPCFAQAAPFQSQFDWLQYQPANADLGVCANDPPRETLDYDALSRITQQTRPDSATIETDYRHYGGALVADVALKDAGGTPLTQTTTVTTPLSKWTTRYDAVTHTHATGAQLPAGVVAGPTDLHTIERYDALGRRMSVWRTGQGGEQTTFVHDGFDRIIDYDDPDQGRWQLDYDHEGRMEARRLVDRMSGQTLIATTWAYDPQGRVLDEFSFDDPMAWQSGQPSSSWEWTYDVDPGAQGPQPLTAGGEIGLPSVAMRRSDDCGGNVEQVLSWRYDRRGRPVEEAYSMHSCNWPNTGAPGTLVAQHAWTAGDQKASTWMPWSGEKISWLYDAAGRPESVADSTGKLAEATYEIQGRLRTLDYSNGVLQDYEYEPGNQSTQALRRSAVMDAFGGVLFDREYTWDAAGNLTRWVDQQTTGASAEDWECSYDGVGTLLGCENRLEGEWFEYSYDALGNLISEDVDVDGTNRWASQYARGTGGLTPMGGMTPPLNAPVARVVGPDANGVYATPGQSFFYDPRGHLIAQRYHRGEDATLGTASEWGLLDANGGLMGMKWQRAFEWNAKGRLDSVRIQGNGLNDEVSRYWYGPGGNRIAERATPLSIEPDAEWTQSRRWAGVRTVEPELSAPRFTLSIALGGTVVAQKTVEPQNGSITMRWLGGDHLGSASIVTDENGKLVRGVRYEPYGRIRSEWGPDADPADYEVGGTDDLFNGKPRNRKAFGLTGVANDDYALEGYDYGARIYLPELSRWASADSITPDTVWEANAFAYVTNNPLKYTDPTGHFRFPNGAAPIYVVPTAEVTKEALAFLSALAGLGLVELHAGKRTLYRNAVLVTEDDALSWDSFQEVLRKRRGGYAPTLEEIGVEAEWYRRAHRIGVHPEIGVRPKPGKGWNWANPKSTKTFGHTFLSHGPKVKRQRLRDRARGTGSQIGQWSNEADAAGLIRDVAMEHGPGVHDVELGEVEGTVVLPDGTEVPADKARVIVKPDGSIRTAFPFSSEHPN